jgi:hypothetical protein
MIMIIQKESPLPLLSMNAVRLLLLKRKPRQGLLRARILLVLNLQKKFSPRLLQPKFPDQRLMLKFRILEQMKKPGMNYLKMPSLRL